MKPDKSKWILAIAWQTGRIEFTKKPKPGAITIMYGPAKNVRDVVTINARESYPSKPGGKDTCLLVPGIPEAAGPTEKVDALIRFQDLIETRVKPYVGLRMTVPHGPNRFHFTVTDLDAAGKISRLRLRFRSDART